MIMVTGLAVTDFTCTRISGPDPGFIVSTSTTPPSVTKTAVLPPVVAVFAEASYRESGIGYVFWSDPGMK